MKVSTILDQIDLGSMALPEFQRGYVWNREQVRGLLHSLYRRYPVGSLLVWVTGSEGASARGDGQLAQGTIKLLLDGQQRMTSLYGVIRGEAPRFFDGNVSAFSNLYFNVADESFEFYAPIKMRDNPHWLPVTEIMHKGIAEFMATFVEARIDSSDINTYVQRINQVAMIQDIDFHIEEVVGEDKSIEIVVDIFNRVNSGGTKLSTADLALARVCGSSPQARDLMKVSLSRWDDAGYAFDLAFFLRCINTVTTGQARFAALKDVTPGQFDEGRKRAERVLDEALNTIASRLGLDHDRVLGSKGALPLLAYYIHQHSGRLSDPAERDQLLYWYLQTLISARYAGSTETILNQDIAAVDEGGIPRLIDAIRLARGSLEVLPDHFAGSSIGARFYPLMYALTRVAGALDWETGDLIKHHMLGRMNQLEVHHIFPKARLYEAGYERNEVNAIANFAFLTKATNLKISAKEPHEYLAAYADKDPNLLSSNWIPLDRNLWHVSRYPEFLAERRRLLADALNQLLRDLRGGALPDELLDVNVQAEVSEVVGVSSIATSDELSALLELRRWVASKGLPRGELLYEVTDQSGEVVAEFDLAWPDGLQAGLSAPVAVLIDEDPETERRANELGYRSFTSADSFQRYVREEIGA